MSQHTPVNRTMSPREWAMLLTLSVLWGGSFFFNGIAVREVPTLTVVVARVVLASLILTLALVLTGSRLAGGRSVWRAFLIMGFLNNAVPFTLIVWGQAHIASGLASILNATTPLFTVLMAHVLTSDEKLSGSRLIGVLLGLLGVAVMIGGAALSSLGVAVVAQLACLGTALSYALAGVFGRRFKAMGVTPMQTASGQTIASSILLFPVMLFVDEPWRLGMPSSYTVLALFAVASLSTALAYILYFRILSTAGATNLLLVTFFVPVSAILLGVTILGETLLLKHVIGMALIGLGLAFIDGRNTKLLMGKLNSRT